MTMVVVPDCSPELKPVVGQKFQYLDFAFTFYDVYARAIGFDMRKQGMRKTDDVTTWYYVVCDREWKKKSNDDDQLNARSGFSMKRRRLSKRCGCKASISFKFFSEWGLPSYIIQEFNKAHNHHMVESEHQQFMSINRKLDDVHKKFILDCSKANIGPTLTFKVLKEILGGFDLVGCTVRDIRNASRDIKAYAHGFDVQMVLDDMAKKKEMSEAFTYHYEVNAYYHMFGDIVAFDSTYNTNRYCMIFTHFTGKDNHGRPTFRQMHGCSTQDDRDRQDLGMRSAIEEWNSRTTLDYHDATAPPILATTLPFEKHASTLYTDSMFKKIQEETVEGNDRCRVLGFSSTEMADTYKLGDINRNSYVVCHDKNDDSYSCECKLFGRQGYLCNHIFFLFRNNEVKKIPEKYYESRWMKTPLVKAVHGEFHDALPTRSIVVDRQTVSKQAISMFYGFLRRFETDIEVLRAFVGGVEELGNSLQVGTPPTIASEKRRMIEEFYGMVRSEVVEVHPPNVVKTKGHASSSASRLISKREKVVKDATRPLRRCKACDEMGHHDSRNCPMLKEMAMEKETRKGKRPA
ncbi:protein FAR1-RELATED SEQUENCE 5-like [Salvia splendens]|uniref:protein FAR1-RELATED SEQUENCE 5-like n=1 Tax=Salvia splendens TaxID=180675 RepID=UPI001C28085B|nr:protein FAR1-RELATED SEQUENCE 5-like [Salvia splendens]